MSDVNTPSSDHEKIIQRVKEVAEGKQSLERKDVVEIAKHASLRDKLREEAKNRVSAERERLALAIDVHRKFVGPQQTPEWELTEQEDKELETLTKELKTTEDAEKPSTRLGHYIDEGKKFFKKTWENVKSLKDAKTWDKMLDWAVEKGSQILEDGMKLWKKFAGWLKETFGPFAMKLEGLGISVPAFLKPDPEEIRDFRSFVENYNKNGTAKIKILEKDPASDLDYIKKIADIQLRLEGKDKSKWAPEKFYRELFSFTRDRARGKAEYTLNDVYRAATVMETETTKNVAPQTPNAPATAPAPGPAAAPTTAAQTPAPAPASSATPLNPPRGSQTSFNQ